MRTGQNNENFCKIEIENLEIDNDKLFKTLKHLKAMGHWKLK